MKLADLNPEFLDGYNGPTGVGVEFDCPCGQCGVRCYVAFRNPIGGGSAYVNQSEPSWQREGETFETLTLTPSIHRSRGCGWHGYLTNGMLQAC